MHPDASERALAELEQARAVVAGIRPRARAAELQMRWSSPAAAVFREALAGWMAAVEAVDTEIATWQHELRARSAGWIGG